MIKIKALYSPPGILQRIFKSVIWKSKVNKILLTFDDSPSLKSTEHILKKLNQYNLKALFFCIGQEVEKYPSLIKEIQSEGHSIGSHSYGHQKIVKKTVKKFEEEIIKTNEIFQNIGLKINFFRPPYGRLNRKSISVVEKYHQKVVMWSIFTYDYKNNLNIVKFALDKFLNSDSIVVFHDKEKSKAIINDSIDYFIDIADKKNFIFGAPSECLI